MQLALYSDAGFYSGDDNTGRAGRRGDFITSPEVGPLFGAVLARMIDDEWKKAGSPDQFTVVDAGAGPGTLARSISPIQSSFKIYQPQQPTSKSERCAAYVGKRDPTRLLI